MNTMYLERFTQDKNFPFYIQIGLHKTSFNVHIHSDFSELMVVLNGTATHVVNSEEYIIKKGDVFIFNSGTSHGFNQPHDLKICNIMYKPEKLNELGSDLNASQGYQALFVLEPLIRKDGAYKSMLQLSTSDLDYAVNQISLMLDEYKNKDHGYQTMLYSHFMELVVYLSRRYAITNQKRFENLFNIATAVNYMNDHFLEQIDFADLANMAGISIRHFNRIFQENYKTTPTNYIIQLKLQHACSLLKNSNLSIADIAYESKFYDGNYLTKQFKKSFGVTPREYRRNIHNTML